MEWVGVDCVRMSQAASISTRRVCRTHKQHHAKKGHLSIAQSAFNALAAVTLDTESYQTQGSCLLVHKVSAHSPVAITNILEEIVTRILVQVKEPPVYMP